MGTNKPGNSLFSLLVSVGCLTHLSCLQEEDFDEDDDDDLEPQFHGNSVEVFDLPENDISFSLDMDTSQMALKFKEVLESEYFI